MAKKLDSDSFYIVRVNNGLGENSELEGMHERMDQTGFRHGRLITCLNQHSEDKSYGYKCMICDQRFEQLLYEQYNTYILKGSEYNKWYTLAQETLKSQKILAKNHVITEHPRSCMKCPKCDDLFLDKTDLAEHKRHCK